MPDSSIELEDVQAQLKDLEQLLPTIGLWGVRIFKKCEWPYYCLLILCLLLHATAVIMPGGAKDTKYVDIISRNESLFVYGETDEEFMAYALRVLRDSLNQGEAWGAAYKAYQERVMTQKKNSRLNVIVATESVTRCWLQFSSFGLHFRSSQLMQIKWSRDLIDVHAEVCPTSPQM